MLGRLTIDLDALRDNYAAIQRRLAPGCRAAAVVKANAYGCGVAACAPALESAGADLFFVATLPEALELRTMVSPHCGVAVLNGFDRDHGEMYLQDNILPVLSSAEHMADYGALAADGQKLAAIVHFDTGMNRLGLRPGECAPDMLRSLDVRLIMSHFACADEDGYALNNSQYEAFRNLCAGFPGVPASLSNSSGIFRGAAFHFDVVRPGMALYGLNPTPETLNPMQPVVALDVPVLQVKTAMAGETCGYGASYRLEKETPLAIVGLGYADGFLRALSNAGTLYWKGVPCPVRGRVSMDLTIVDLSGVAENDRPGAGDFLEAIGPHQTADDLARDAGTIGYEILTSLSRRYQRRSVGEVMRMGSGRS